MTLIAGVLISMLGLEMAVYSIDMTRSLVGLFIMFSGMATIMWSPE